MDSALGESQMRVPARVEHQPGYCGSDGRAHRLTRVNERAGLHARAWKVIGIRTLTKVVGAILIAGLFAMATSTGTVRVTNAAALDARVFGTNMGLFDGSEQVLTSAATRQFLVGWHTPVIRMPFRSSLTDAVELQALQVIKSIGATPLVIVRGAVDTNVLADDTHELALVAQVFGTSTVYVEYGNEEDLSGVSATTYTTSWNAVVPSLKAAYPTYQFIGPVNFQAAPTYIGYFVGHAVPKPDIVSWHWYVCSPTDATTACMSRIASLPTHVNDTNNAEIAAVGHTFPFFISEWNMDPQTGDARYSDPTVIGPWTTQALQMLNSQVPAGLVGAQQYVAASHGDFALINSSSALTPQGQAFQAAMGGGSPSPLSASASGVPTAGDAPLTVNFTGTPAGGTSPYTYSWSFGDATTSTSQSPSHTYAAAGSYSATLKVTDATSASATSSAVTITVNALPTATASANPTTGNAPLAVSFTGSASSGTVPYPYAWTFGDGGTSTSQSPSHTYSSAGSYTAQLKVTDAARAIATANALAIVVSTAPVPLSASAKASPAARDAPLQVTFTGTAAGGTGPYSFSWSLGDGTTASTQTPVHTFAAAGAYTATLTVTDAAGHTAAGTAAVVVSPTLGALASASASH